MSIGDIFAYVCLGALALLALAALVLWFIGKLMDPKGGG